MTRNVASIDIGTFTARLLIAEISGTTGTLRPLVRDRAYIRLGQGFDEKGKKVLQPQAMERTLEVLGDFLQHIRKFRVSRVLAVATGVVREAANRGEFLDSIFEHTGIRVRVISGKEEALLTGKGVVNALDIGKRPYFIFDLGGGSTEFLFGSRENPVLESVPLGALIMTQDHIHADPPEKEHIRSLMARVDETLSRVYLGPLGIGDDAMVVGTGGTVTTLACMLHGISLQEIGRERVSGLVLKVREIEELFDRIKGLNTHERSGLPGMDPDRARVILAGALITLRILYFLKSDELTASFSDLLEGILIDDFDGEGNGKK
jgi:exopolyphosphatase/guanosine-5'-triphosphate,3'-diphosphate pyrophosphatase